MKKTVMILIAVLIVLIGCSGKTQEEKETDYFQLEKVAKIEIYTATNPGKPVHILKSHSDLEDFVGGLQLEDWSMTEESDAAAYDYQFRFLQEETVKLGESKKKQQELQEFFSLFADLDEQTVMLEKGKLKLHFSIPEKVIGYLEQTAL